MKKALFLTHLLPWAFISQAQFAVTSESHDKSTLTRSGGSYGSVSVAKSYEVVSIHVDASIKNQLVDVTVTQRIKNPNKHSMEIEIFFPLPNQGIVQNFMLMVNGQEVPGELMPKEEARRIYEGIVRRKQDPALMEYVGYGLFKTSVFPIGINEEREISVKYTQMLERKMEQVHFTYPFGTQKFSSNMLKTLSLTVRIQSTEPIKTIFSPSDEIKVKRNGDKQATIEMELKNTLPTNDFKLNYSLAGGTVGATVLSYKPNASTDGYFMLLASPAISIQPNQVTNKNMLIVLDRSGSMSGKKIEQGRKAMEFVINNLNDGDLFNIITFDDRVEVYKEEIQRYSKKSRDDANSYISGVMAGGGTNIDEALKTAIEMIPENGNPNYILFLTDGMPTVGERNEMKIADNFERSNKKNARLFVFGVGNDVNARLLDRLSTRNGGVTEYVKPSEDIETAVAALYSQISNPVMSDLSVKFNNTDIRSAYPEKMPDLFKGGQLVWVGKYTKPGKNKVTIKGKINGEWKEFSYDVVLNSHVDGRTHDYLEKIWASRRVAYLVNQIDLHGKNEEMVAELTKLSKDHGILTPYTAFLAREDMVLADDRELINHTRSGLSQLNEVRGESANIIRSENQALMKSAAPAGYVSNNKKYADQAGGSVSNMNNIGNKTFYKQKNQWVDVEVSEKEIQQSIKIKKFSSEYFNLANSQDAYFNQYLSLNENIVLKLNGKVYNIIH
ncbi:MAG: VIT domain-containing protein [Flavobacteriales bacterium]